MFNLGIAIEYLGKIFSCFGALEIIVSDNGTQFKSREFTTFVPKYGVDHRFTGAYTPHSKAAVQVKRSINAALP